MIRLAVLLVWLAGAVWAQGTVSVLSAEANETRNGASVSLRLSDVTPYRVFTLDSPRRLVLDVEGLALDDLETDVLAAIGPVTAVRAGPFRPGWSRVIFDLAGPFAVEAAGMSRDGTAVDLVITLAPVTDEAFADTAGAPPDPGWDVATGFDPATARRLAEGSDYVVLLDPAHGGIDRGAVAGGIREADLTLIMAEELAWRLNAEDGVTAVLSRQGDTFVPLSARISLADEVGADLVISFHAVRDQTKGLRVATYGPDAKWLSDHAAEGAGNDRQPTTVAGILGDLSRAETLPAAERVADALVAGFARAGVRLPVEARLQADLPILREAGFPAVVVLLGGLDDADTRAFVASASGRNMTAAAIADTVILLAR